MENRRRLLMGSGAVKVNKVLENNSWETIAEISRQGRAREFWKIGDEKTFTVGSKVVTAQIIGFDHDNVVNSKTYGRSKAGITFQLKDIYFTSKHITNDQESTGWKENWNNSYLRTSVLPGYWNNLEKELKNEIVNVNKDYSVSREYITTETVSENLFILSEMEVFGTRTYGNCTEGTQYTFYSAGNSKIKKQSGVAKQWWTRSIYKTYVEAVGSICTGQYRVVVQTGGTAYYVKGNNTSVGIAFAFCV